MKQQAYSALKKMLAAVMIISIMIPVNDYARAEQESKELPMTNQSNVSVTNTNTNLTNWNVVGGGKMIDSPEGLLLASGSNENVMAVSATKSEDFIYEADVMVKDMEADTGLVFRSNNNGRSSYMLQIIPKDGLLRLQDANEGAGRLKEERQVVLKRDEIYHLKVKAEGSNLKVYWGANYKPIIDVTDTAYSAGYLGLHVWDGSALFQNIQVSDLHTNLKNSILTRGEWMPHLKGAKAVAQSREKSIKVYNTTADDLEMEGDITLDAGSPNASAGLLFRGSKDGSAGYVASIQGQGDQIQVLLMRANGAIVSKSARLYPRGSDSKHHLEINASGDRIQIFMDGYTPAAIDIKDKSYTSGYSGMIVNQGTAYFQDVYLTQASDYYTERYRPQYHYSPARGSASDPNGMVYFEGEYHLFHQDGGQWAHAVSKDMIHWKRLPIALAWNDYGHVWSGSAVADLTNASGLFTNTGGKGLIAYYTSFTPDAQNGNQKIGLAYSTDAGRTWTYSKEHPIVIQNPGKNDTDPGGWDFRDPKVVRDEVNNRWIMVVSGGDHIRFFSSNNLIDWTLTDNFGYGAYVRGGVWECPDLFQLPVDGNGARKWVLMISTGANPKTGGSDEEYFVGELTADGKFKNDNPAGKVLKADWGKEFYASSSFSDVPGGRRIMMAWMTNWDYPFSFPTTPWKGELTIPRELSLKSTGAGIRLIQTPIAELTSLREPLVSVKNQVVTESQGNLLKGVNSGAYEIEAVLQLPEQNAASEFGFNLRTGGDQHTVVGYNKAKQKLYVDRSASGATDFSNLFTTLHEASLAPAGNQVKIRVFVDESSIEVFGNDGEVVISDVILPDSARRGMSFYTKGGAVKVISMKVHAMDNIWRISGSSDSRVIMDRSDMELTNGQTGTLFASVENSKGAAKPITWKSSQPNVIQIISSDNETAVIRAVGPGEATITASSGHAISGITRITVSSGEFKTNLTGWKSQPSSSLWTLTPEGIRGSYTSDANYMAAERAGNFTYEADMELAKSGGAGSILFRASADGNSGYYFNLDPNMKSIRLFYKVEGRFEERQVLAKVSRFIQSERKYHVKIVADGPHLQIDLDGERVVDLKDGTFAEGQFGVNVFGGQAYYQNVMATHTSGAGLTKVHIKNENSGKSLQYENSINGAPVAVTDDDANSTNQDWVFVPVGDGTYSIRNIDDRALDLDTGQNRIQLYNYLGFDNQRWTKSENADGTVTILSAHNGKALEVSEDGTQLQLGEVVPGSSRQKWRLTGE
ncbi:Levanase precursor [compost metagenome]